jgi:DHA1 family bicyclomycin/chloramphenicol resistance-like MFS transporter
MTKRPGLAVLIALSAVGPLALNIFMPSMPRIAEEFGVPYGTVQYALTLYLVAIASSQLFIGPISDRFGRRPVMLGGMLLYLVATAICALSQNIETLIFGRMLQAVGGSTGLVLGRAVVRDLYGRDRSASMIGYVTTAMMVVPLVTPTIGGFLDQFYGWQASFIFAAIFGVVVLVFAWFAMHETKHDLVESLSLFGTFNGIGVIARYPAFWGYAMFAAMLSAMFFSFLAGAPYIMIELMGRAPSEYGLMFMFPAVGYMAGNFLSGRYSVRIGADRMMAVGVMFSVLGALSMVGFAVGGMFNPWTIFIPMVLISMANGLGLPNALASAISIRPELAGSGSGLCGFLQMGIGAAVAQLVGYLQTDSQWPMVIIIAVSGLMAFLFYLLGAYTRRRKANAVDPVQPVTPPAE